MPSLCPVCQETFSVWVDYHEHINLAHGVQPLPAQGPQVALGPIKLQPWPGPMDKAEKARLVAKGERRIGKQYFIGG